MSQHLTTRRNLLAGTTAAAAVGAGELMAYVRPAVAAAAHPDAALLALGREWETSVAHCKEAYRLRNATALSYDRQDEPEAVFWRDSDAAIFPGLEPDEGSFGRQTTNRRGFFKRQTFDALQIALPELKRRADFPRDTPPTADIGARIDRRIVRIEEILTADAAWEKENHERWVAAGMKEVEDAADEAEEASREIRLKIIHSLATTREGILLKIRVAAECFGDTPAEVEEIILEHMDDWSGNTVALSILRDLLRLQGGTVLAG